MGAMSRFDSERRELVRERREARIVRKRDRWQARERKRAPGLEMAVGVSAAQRGAEEQVRAEVDRIVAGAMERHDARTASSRAAEEAPAHGEGGVPAVVVAAAARPRPVGSRAARRPSGDGQAVVGAPVSSPAGSEQRVSRRERDIAAFRERRQGVASEARREARARIARAGEPVAVADALAATSPETAPWWRREREGLERAIAGGRIAEVGAVARRALWAVSRDAARSSHRTERDPELALAVCVAYAIIARLPRTALRSAECSRPAPGGRDRVPPGFWR